MNSGNISSLAFLAKTSPDMFKDVLLTCDYTPFKDISGMNFSDRYNEIIKFKGMNDGLTDLFNLYLLTKFLINQNGGCPSWSKTFLADNLEIKKILGLCLDDAEKGVWYIVPAVFTGGDTAYIRLFILGLLDSKPADGMVPGWARVLLSDSLVQAMENARQVAIDFVSLYREKFFLCFPLTMPGKTVQFKNTSVGLPLALGFARLLTQKNITEQLAATGSITVNGSITKVGHLEKKIAGIDPGFDGLLFPSENTVVKNKKNIIFLPVSTFEQAWMFVSLYSGRDKDKLPLLSHIVKNPKLFVKNIGNLPAQWIIWIKQERSIDKILNEIIQDPSLFFIFTSHFEKIVENYQLDTGKAISKLIEDDVLEQLSKKAPVSALKWCAANLSLANHLGRIKAASKWEQYGLKMTKTVLKADINTVVTFYNHAMVFAHNRFSFCKNLPADLKKLMEFLESQYQKKCQFGCSTDLLLGRLYGTIMQNFAFCGPGNIKQSEIFSQKARKALGEGMTSEFRKEWKRHLGYITFARLDAEDFIRAEESLKAYLEVDCLEDILVQKEEPGPWGYALLARFFQQTGKHPLKIKFYQWIMQRLNRITTADHPWQLFYYNTGQIAFSLGHEDKAEKLMNTSIDICFSNHLGPSIHVMSLLPISMLVHYKKNTEPAWEKGVKLSAGKLDAGHFNFLKKYNFHTALKQVKKHPEQIFPFTYR